MASVDNACELSSMSEVQAPASPEVPTPDTKDASPTQRTTASSRLAPAPVPASNPWKRADVKPAPDATFTRKDVVRDETRKELPIKRTTGKEKWIPYTPVVTTSPPAPGAGAKSSQRPKSRKGGRRHGQANGPSPGTPERASSSSSKEPSPSAGKDARAERSERPNNRDQGYTKGYKRGAKNDSPAAHGANGPAASRAKGGAPENANPKYYTPSLSQYDMSLNMLVQQMEYYFSIDNLCKDIFLRKQMNSKGLIPIAVLVNFNRVRVLSNGDFNLVAEACRWAPSTEVIGSKVRLGQGWERWVLPIEDRDAPGKNDSDEEDDTPKFQIESAVPFVPKRSQ